MYRRRVFHCLAALLLFGLAGCQTLNPGLGELPDNHIDISGPGILVAQDGTAFIETVVAAAPGWVCVQADLLGQPGESLGCTGVAAGESRNVELTVETRGLTPNLHIALYQDLGVAGQPEVPEPDVPALTSFGRPVVIEETLLADSTWVEVNNQPLANGTTVTVDRVYSPVPAILVIHDARDQRVLGATAVHSGESLSVSVTLEVRGELEGLLAELHWDTREPGVLNLTDPAAKLASGEFLAAPFAVTAGN